MIRRPGVGPDQPEKIDFFLRFSIAFDLMRRTEQDRWTFTGSYNFGRQRDPGTGNKTTTTDNWQATGQYDYFFTPNISAFIEYKFLDYTSTQINTNKDRNLGQQLLGAGVRFFFH